MNLAASYIIERGIDTTVKGLFTFALNRASDRRAQEFFQQFSEALSESDILDSEQEQTIIQLLSQIDQDPDRAEILFSAYRQVVFSRSHTLGPRYIAVSTAKIIKELRIANSEEQRTLLAAEQFSDIELVELSKWTLKNYKTEQPKAIELDSYHTDSNRDKCHGAPATLDLTEYMGSWASLAQSLGLLRHTTHMVTVEYREDSERHIDNDGVETITKYLIYLDDSMYDLACGVRFVSKGTKYFW